MSVCSGSTYQTSSYEFIWCRTLSSSQSSMLSTSLVHRRPIKIIQEEFWLRQSRHTCTCERTVSIVWKYNVRITSPQVLRVFISLQHSQIKWELHFFSYSIFFEQKDMEGEPGPDHSSQTQQRAITRFASTFCSWCLIRVTSSTPLRNRFTQSLRFLCVRGDFCRQMLPGCFEKQSDVTEA